MNLRQRQPREHDEKHLRFDNIAGRRFGKLVAISHEGRAQRTALWLVRCDCGNERVVRRSNLLNGQKSCGCMIPALTSARFSTHGLTTPGDHHPLHRTWWGMISRCHAEAYEDKRYQERGIRVCDRWRFGDAGKTGFEYFLDDMGPRPSKAYSIDRIDNDGNYEPGNCRWATQTQQQRNKRTNRKVIFRGEEMVISAAIELSGINSATVWARIGRGWEPEIALTKAVDEKRRRHAATENA